MVAILTSWSLAMAPLSLMPAQTAFAQEPSAEEESDLTGQAANLEVKLIQLTDRATYPRVPRLGVRGYPSQSEIQEAGDQLAKLSKAILALPTTVNLITDEKLEPLPYFQIQAFFDCAQKFEGLKILMGQKPNVLEWDQKYRLEFPLSDLSQLRFTQIASFLSDSFVQLPGIKDELLIKRAEEAGAVRTHLDIRHRSIVMSLSPSFVEPYERLYYLNQMNTKSAILFAGHFAVHRLQDSLAATRFLLRQTAEGTPEIPSFWRERLVSMDIKRSEMILTQKLKLMEVMKPRLFEAIQSAYANLENQGRALVFDVNFYADLRKIAKLPEGLVDILQVNYDETSSWTEAIRAMVNLWSLDNVRQDTASVVYEAKRISLRWMITGTEAWSSQFTPETAPKVAQFIDEKAKEFTQLFMSDPKLNQVLSEIALRGAAEARQQMRADFEKKLIVASKKLKEFETSRVNLNALMKAKKFEIKDLTDRNPSPFVAAALEALGKSPSYEAGYLAYRMLLMNMLTAYKLHKNLIDRKRPLTISLLDEYKEYIRFNPDVLVDNIPQKYIDVLKSEGRQEGKLAAISRFLWGDDSGRAMDLKGLIELGKLLHFDEFEKLDPKAKDFKVNPQTIKLSKGLLGFGSEMQAYFDEFKKDIIDNAPILGASAEDPNFDPWTQINAEPFGAGQVAPAKAVWEYLAAGHLNERQVSDLIETHLQKVPARIESNMASLQSAWEKVEQGSDDSIRHVNEEMRVLTTRATQLSFLVSSFSGFSELHEEVRNELLQPGFWEREWKGFKDWSDGVLNYMVGFMIFQLVGAKTMAAGRIADQLGKALTPVFGPNFSRLNFLIFSILGISVGDAAVKGFGTEVYRTSILQRYFECGAGGPCVALYSDVAQQSEIARSSRMEVVGQLGFMGAILLGFWGARYAVARFSRSAPQATILQFKADLRTLGMTENSAINRTAIDEGLATAKYKARQLPDPVATELAVTYAEQAALRLEKAVWTEAERWISIEQRFKADFKKMGLGLREAKTQSKVDDVFEAIKAQYKNGELTLSQFQERKSALLAYYQAMSSTWIKMEKDPLMKAFYEKVFDFSSGSRLSEVKGNLNFLNKNIHSKFMREIEKEYVKTATSFRYKDVLDNMIKQTQANPARARENMETLRKLIKNGSGK